MEHCMWIHWQSLEKMDDSYVWLVLCKFIIFVLPSAVLMSLASSVTVILTYCSVCWAYKFLPGHRKMSPKKSVRWGLTGY